MSGSVTLTANESVTVVATGSGVTGLMQVAVTATDAVVPEPVPALPLIGQLLLGLGLLGGGVAASVSAAASGLGEPIDPESPGGVTGEGGFGATASGSLSRC